ncbi:H-type small acid-soluble spore protein [Lysinibacillus sp. FSL M8-0216]|uniref:Small acid-soluble spore protein H (Minor) n=1 Tax=Lysinibacillus fusiformis TaxID=28031 RepID=A0A1H9GHR7_9BACI|nr:MULTISPECIES: H-type small acid-soluble spore protein [Lysinibacillus]HAU33753.1 small, acid-soluble spore protein, H family [Lysinibacillus sp.]MCG7435486.1 H-type small acid-soluble spore protein [Lysinibacillus fusiformis]MED4670904.1 H-type small acid-soluble spore protein [Lysinibacillus fusiformis]NOG28612.1 small, acid-soluble spore protein, H family [Lysinibacillus fusiformis]QAS56964.1 small, acid-soluble spore protein, H family [Lysinibacillus sphaericus]
MDFQRAHEIVASPLEYEVSYNGVSVWIDKIHADEKTATVLLRRSLGESSDVDISELKEEYLVH